MISDQIYRCETVRDLVVLMEKMMIDYSFHSNVVFNYRLVIDHKIKFVYLDQCEPNHFSFLYFDGDYLRGSGNIVFLEIFPTK